MICDSCAVTGGTAAAVLLFAPSQQSPVTNHAVLAAMERKRVNAWTIRSAGYDAGKQVLEVEFTSDSIVRYSGVSLEVHRRFMIGGPPR